tara:strand:+ start:425 stop:646 length:222 start_codon:yes stop_codon:yes gene_type:complete
MVLIKISVEVYTPTISTPPHALYHFVMEFKDTSNNITYVLTQHSQGKSISPISLLFIPYSKPLLLHFAPQIIT